MASAIRSAQYRPNALGSVSIRCGRPVEVGVGHPEAAGGQRIERRLERRDAGDGQRALRRAVIGDGPRYHLVLARLAGQLEVLLGQLPGALDGLAATGGEEDAVEVARRVTGDALGEFDRRWRGVGPQREEGQRLGLLGRGLGEFLAAVADLDDEEPRQSVDVALALVVEDVHALAAGDDRRRDALAVAGEVPPQVPVRPLRRRSLAVSRSESVSVICVPQLYCCLTSFR